jgi:hypothetical protein
LAPAANGCSLDEPFEKFVKFEAGEWPLRAPRGDELGERLSPSPLSAPNLKLISKMGLSVLGESSCGKEGTEGMRTESGGWDWGAELDRISSPMSSSFFDLFRHEIRMGRFSFFS